MDLRRIWGGAIKKGDEVIGNRTKIKIVKNKVGSSIQRKLSFKSCTVKGVSRIAELLDIGSNPWNYSKNEAEAGIVTRVNR